MVSTQNVELRPYTRLRVVRVGGRPALIQPHNSLMSGKSWCETSTYTTAITRSRVVREGVKPEIIQPQ